MLSKSHRLAALTEVWFGLISGLTVAYNEKMRRQLVFFLETAILKERNNKGYLLKEAK